MLQYENKKLKKIREICTFKAADPSKIHPKGLTVVMKESEELLAIFKNL